MSRAEMSDAEAAAYYYANRDDPEEWGEQVDAFVSEKPDSVISIRRVIRGSGERGPGRGSGGA